MLDRAREEADGLGGTGSRVTARLAARRAGRRTGVPATARAPSSAGAAPAPRAAGPERPRAPGASAGPRSTDATIQRVTQDGWWRAPAARAALHALLVAVNGDGRAPDA